jgi:hypothetical protein
MISRPRAAASIKTSSKIFCGEFCAMRHTKALKAARQAKAPATEIQGWLPVL